MCCGQASYQPRQRARKAKVQPQPLIAQKATITPNQQQLHRERNLKQQIMAKTRIIHNH